MPPSRRNFLQFFGKFVIAGILFSALYSLFAIRYSLAPPGGALAAGGSAVATSTVTVPGNSLVISAVTLNGGGNIVLTPNATTAVSVVATITDNAGCNAMAGATSTILLYRSGITSSTCDTMGKAGPATDFAAFCYRATAFTASSTCSAGTINTTTTFAVQYYAQPTDSSSSYDNQNWMATVTFTETSNTTTTADSSVATSTNDILTLLALSVRESAINYGTLGAGVNTSGTNQVATVQNVGNATMTLQLAAAATLTTSTLSIATSSQHYATGTFTFGGNEQVLSSTAQTVSGFTLLPVPTPNLSWARTTQLPSSSYTNKNVIAFNNFIYQIGGLDKANNRTSSVLFAPISATNSVGTWTVTTELSTSTFNHSVVAYNGYLYMTGGNPFGVITSTVLFAAISATNSVSAWANTTPLPSGTASHASLINNNFIYVIGGANGGAAANITSTVYFAPISSTNSVGAWATTTPLPSALQDHSANIYNGYIYVVGGISNVGSATTTVLFAPISATNSVGAWATTTPLPQALRGPALINNGVIFAIAGCVPGCSAVSTIYSALISATNSVGAWSTPNALPSAIMAHAAFVYNGFIYSVGGQDSGGVATSTVFFTPIAANPTYWGLTAAGASFGTYVGTTTFTAVFSP